ncbi:hypothetical protein ABFS82_01G104300 [Erythranthe guttata]
MSLFNKLRRMVGSNESPRVSSLSLTRLGWPVAPAGRSVILAACPLTSLVHLPSRDVPRVSSAWVEAGEKRPAASPSFQELPSKCSCSSLDPAERLMLTGFVANRAFAFRGTETTPEVARLRKDVDVMNNICIKLRDQKEHLKNSSATLKEVEATIRAHAENLEEMLYRRKKMELFTL